MYLVKLKFFTESNPFGGQDVPVALCGEVVFVRGTETSTCRALAGLEDPKPTSKTKHNNAQRVSIMNRLIDSETRTTKGTCNCLKYEHCCTGVRYLYQPFLALKFSGSKVIDNQLLCTLCIKLLVSVLCVSP